LRFLNGAGIGGHYTRSSTFRTRCGALSRLGTDLYQRTLWIGDARGETAAIVGMIPTYARYRSRWRPLSHGEALGLIVFVMRMWIPESPRWLMIPGRPDQANAIVDEIEQSVVRTTAGQQALPKSRCECRITPHSRSAHSWSHVIERARWSGWCDGGRRFSIKRSLHLRAGADDCVGIATMSAGTSCL